MSGLIIQNANGGYSQLGGYTPQALLPSGPGTPYPLNGRLDYSRAPIAGASAGQSAPGPIATDPLFARNPFQAGAGAGTNAPGRPIIAPAIGPVQNALPPRNAPIPRRIENRPTGTPVDDVLATGNPAVIARPDGAMIINPDPVYTDAAPYPVTRPGVSGPDSAARPNTNVYAGVDSISAPTNSRYFNDSPITPVGGANVDAGGGVIPTDVVAPPWIDPDFGIGSGGFTRNVGVTGFTQPNNYFSDPNGYFSDLNGFSTGTLSGVPTTDDFGINAGIDASTNVTTEAGTAGKSFIQRLMGGEYGSLSSYGDALQGLGSIFNAYTGYRTLKEGRKQNRFNRNLANRNLENQARTINQYLADRYHSKESFSPGSGGSAARTQAYIDEFGGVDGSPV